MNWEKYKVSVADYFRLTERYELRFEYMDGIICTKTGNPIILLGGVASEEPSSEAALIVISDATQEEVAQVAAFVASLRGNKRSQKE